MESTQSPPTNADSAGEVPSAVEADGGWPKLLRQLSSGQDLDRSTAEAAMTDILAGRTSPIHIAALLVGLKAKGETVDELVGLATAMRAAAEPLTVPAGTIDIVGTGGSAHRRSHALNVSTMASIVAASAGATVCKHGNRRASSTSGSFDFLEALGVAIELGPKDLEVCIEEVGLGFAFARSFHPAMRFAGPVRAELGIPTTFNLLGPLANPGRVSRQVIGVASVATAELLAETLRALDATSTWVVAGADGLDELSTTGDSVAHIVTPTGVSVERIEIEALGLERTSLDELVGGSPAENVSVFHEILAGTPGPHRDIVLLNAAAGLVVADRVETLADGLDLAARAVDDGRSTHTLERLISVTNRLVDEQK